MHSDDEYEPDPQNSGSAIVSATGFSPEAMESMEQIQKDYRAVYHLMPAFIDKIDELSKQSMLVTAAEFCYLLQHDEHEFKESFTKLIPANPLNKSASAEKAIQLLHDYEFAVGLLGERARYFCGARYEAPGLNEALRSTAEGAAEITAQQALYYQLEKARPYVPDIHHVRREAAWKHSFPHFTITEMLDFVGDSLKDAHYPQVVMYELAKWGERFIAFDTFVDKDFTDDCEDIEAFQDDAHAEMSRHSFRVLPTFHSQEWEIEKTHGIGRGRPSLDEVLFSYSYLEDIETARRELQLDNRDALWLPIENILKVNYLARHALAHDYLERELESAKKKNPSNRPDLTFDSYALMVKAQRHMLAREMQDYVCSLRSRFADLHVEDEAQKIGTEWEQMLREE